MEKLQCPKCQHPTYHATKDFYNKPIHPKPMCLSCGQLNDETKTDQENNTGLSQ